MKMKFILLFCLPLLISSCDLLDDSPCGVHETFDLYLLGDNIVKSSMGGFNTYMEGSNRVFQWSQLVENICTEEHAKIEARIALLDETTTGVSARTGATWLFLFQEIFPMSKSGSDLKGSGQVGLMQAFDKEPAWCTPKVEVFFPSKGSITADTTFLKENVISVELKMNYRKH